MAGTPEVGNSEYISPTGLPPSIIMTYNENNIDLIQCLVHLEMNSSPNGDQEEEKMKMKIE